MLYWAWACLYMYEKEPHPVLAQFRSMRARQAGTTPPRLGTVGVGLVSLYFPFLYCTPLLAYANSELRKRVCGLWAGKHGFHILHSTRTRNNNMVL